MSNGAQASPRAKVAALLPLLLVIAGLGLIVSGLVTATRSAENGGNENCPTDTELLAKFDYQAQQYIFDVPTGNEGVVKITNATSTGADWTSQVPVGGIVVKGGPAAVVTTLDPAASSGTFDNTGLPLVGSGQVPDISNIQFCSDTSTAPTTVAEPTTTVVETTTTPEPATTVPGEATTTAPSTTSSTSTTSTTSTISTPPATAQSVLPGTQGGLAFTGARTLTMVAVGAALVATGSALALISRRRRGRT